MKEKKERNAGDILQPGGKKLLVKQSYLLLTWIFFISQPITKKPLASDEAEKLAKSLTPKFFVKPLRKSKFTITKAPMAHKTFSQEQYGFRVYNINVSFKLQVFDNLAHGIDQRGVSYNGALLLLMALRHDPFFFETNLFMLQRIGVMVPSSDQTFLTLF